MKVKELFGPHTRTVRLPTALATAGTEDTVALFRAPFNLTVTAVRYLPNAGLTGVTATEATLDVQNRGAAGDGTTSIASISFIDSEDATAFVPKDLTLGAAADRDVDEGEIIALDKSVTSTGLAIDGAIEIEFRNRGV